MERHRVVQRGMEMGRDAEQVVPHPYVVDINQEGYLGSMGSQPQTNTQSRVQVPGSYISTTSGYKNQSGLGQWKKLGLTGDSS